MVKLRKKGKKANKYILDGKKRTTSKSEDTKKSFFQEYLKEMIATAIVMGFLAIYFLVGREVIDPKLAKERAKLQEKIEKKKDMAARKTFCSRQLLMKKNVEDVGKLKLLLDNGGDVNYSHTHKRRRFPLLVAAQNWYEKSVKELLRRGADKDRLNYNNKSALYVACEKQHLNVVKILLEAKVKIDTKAEKDTTPVGVTVQNGNKEILKALLKAGADKNACPFDADPKWTLLHEACEQGHLQVVKFLTEEGATIDKQDEDLSTPLMVASLQEHVEVVKSLVNSITDENKKKEYIQMKDNNGDTAIDITDKQDIKDFLTKQLA